MTENTATLSVTEALARLDRASAGGMGQDITALAALADAVRAELAPLPEGEAERMAEQAAHDARTMAPPVPGVTVNSGHVIRAIITTGGQNPAWFVTAEDPERGRWVTWLAEMSRSGERAGRLAYSGGHYFWSQDARQRALADLAKRAGLLYDIAPLIAAEMTRYEHSTTAEDKRAARRLRTWAAR